MTGEPGAHLSLPAEEPSEPSCQAPILDVYDGDPSDGLDMIIDGANDTLNDENGRDAFRFEQPDSENEDEDEELIDAEDNDHVIRPECDASSFAEADNAIAAQWSYFEENMDDLDPDAPDLGEPEKADAAAHLPSRMLESQLARTAGEGPPSSSQVSASEWKEMADAALSSPTTMAALQRLVGSTEADAHQPTRNALQAKIAAAESFAVRAKNAAMSSPSFDELQQLAEQGTALNVELKILDHIRELIRKADALKLKITGLTESQNFDIRAVRAVLSELDRLPVSIPEGAELREKWKVVQVWTDRVRQVTTVPRRTRTARSARGNQSKAHVSALQQLLDEAARTPLLQGRSELAQLRRQQAAAARWVAEAKTALQSRESVQLEALMGLLEKAEELAVHCEEEGALRARVWLRQAAAAAAERPQYAQLQELIEAKDAQGKEGVEELMAVLREKRARAEGWMQRARGAMSDKREATEFRALLDEAKALEVETEEEFLLQFHVESGEAWEQRAEAALAADKGDAKALKALLRESDRIAVCLHQLLRVERRAEELERLAENEDEADECNWAQCDGCQKWRRLGPEQVVNDDDPFYCLHAGKSCASPHPPPQQRGEEREDEWDEEEEEVTATGEGQQVDELDDVPLAQRRFLAAGSIVFAQFAYYPFWPAEVVDPEQACRQLPALLRERKHGHVLVRFFGPGNKNWVDRRRVIPFHPDKDPNSKPIRSQSFKNAMTQATARFIPSKPAEHQPRAPAPAERNESDVEQAAPAKSRGDEEYLPAVQKKARGEQDKVPKGKGIRRVSKEVVCRKRERENEATPTAAESKKQKKPSSSQKKGAAQALLPSWFLRLPAGWQGSYKDLCAVRDAEGTLKERMEELTAQGRQEDMRREVRNMVTCCFLGALQLTPPPEACSIPRVATSVEQELWTHCGGTICAAYRKRYRILVMALRSRQPLRAALLDGTLKPFLLADMSVVELEAYGKLPARAPARPASVQSELAKQPPTPKPEPATRPPLPSNDSTTAAGSPLAQPLLERKVPAALPSLQLPDVSTTEPTPPDSPAAQAKPGTPPTPTEGPRSFAAPEPPSGSPSPKSAPPAAHLADGEVGAGAGSGEVGGQVWSGYVCKHHMSDVRVKAIHLSGAAVRCRLPAQLDIVGRIKLEALKQFLKDLERSRSRQKTIVRLDVHEQSKSDGPYAKLRDSLQELHRVGVINLGRDNQAYVLAPDAARQVLGLDGQGLYGVFVLRGHGGSSDSSGKPSTPQGHGAQLDAKSSSGGAGAAAGAPRGDRAAPLDPRRPKQPADAAQPSGADAAAARARAAAPPAQPAARKRVDATDSGSLLLAALLGGATEEGLDASPAPPTAAASAHAAPGQDPPAMRQPTSSHTDGGPEAVSHTREAAASAAQVAPADARHTPAGPSDPARPPPPPSASTHEQAASDARQSGRPAHRAPPPHAVAAHQGWGHGGRAAQEYESRVAAEPPAHAGAHPMHCHRHAEASQPAGERPPPDTSRQPALPPPQLPPPGMPRPGMPPPGMPPPGMPPPGMPPPGMPPPTLQQPLRPPESAPHYQGGPSQGRPHRPAHEPAHGYHRAHNQRGPQLPDKPPNLHHRGPPPDVGHRGPPPDVGHRGPPPDMGHPRERGQGFARGAEGCHPPPQARSAEGYRPPRYYGHGEAGGAARGQQLGKGGQQEGVQGGAERGEARAQGYTRDAAEWGAAQPRPRDAERRRGMEGGARFEGGEGRADYSRGGGTNGTGSGAGAGGGRGAGGRESVEGSSQSEVMNAFETIKALLENKDAPQSPPASHPPPSSHPTQREARGGVPHYDGGHVRGDPGRAPPAAAAPADAPRAPDLRELPTEALIQQLLTMMPHQPAPPHPPPPHHQHHPPPHNYGPPAHFPSSRSERDDKWKQQRRY